MKARQLCSIDPKDFKFPPRTPKKNTKLDWRPNSGFIGFEQVVAKKLARPRIRRRCVDTESASVRSPAMRRLELVTTSSMMNEPGGLRTNQALSYDTTHSHVNAAGNCRDKDETGAAGGIGTYQSSLSRTARIVKDPLRPSDDRLPKIQERQQERRHRQLDCSGESPASQIRPPSRSEQKSVRLKRRNIRDL